MFARVPIGIGDLGDEAYRFADFLLAGGQSLWQVLPLGPTGYGDSPYACYSAFAGNTLLISPERLIAAGLLAKKAVEAGLKLPFDQGALRERELFADCVTSTATCGRTRARLNAPAISAPSALHRRSGRLVKAVTPVNASRVSTAALTTRRRR